MKAYLRNGQTIKITQQMANDIVKIARSKENGLVCRDIVDPNKIIAFFNTDEIIAIR